MSSGQSSIMIELAGQNLAAMDVGGYSDPYFIIYLIPASGKRIKLYKSEEVMRNLNPIWQPRVLYVSVISLV